MKRVITGVGILILVLILVCCPVQAFTAKNLDISIQSNTDATVTFSYDLTWYENIVVFSRIVDPTSELKNAFKTQFSKNVEVTSVSGNQAQFLVENFASRSVNNGVVSLSTPSLSFRNAEKVLDRYWFARFVTPDFSPEVTSISFPDGYSEVFYNQDQIPSVSHTMDTTS
ncbi:MAG: hypothetical protein ABSG28_11335 [Methanoregula sp.]|jgi:hypothetical protein|uniref:hypothetical protein n=1 Tax=Methanoregula sp. TaxID=2052170 RepID=UPI003C1E954E